MSKGRAKQRLAEDTNLCLKDNLFLGDHLGVDFGLGLKFDGLAKGAFLDGDRLECRQGGLDDLGFELGFLFADERLERRRLGEFFAVADGLVLVAVLVIFLFGEGEGLESINKRDG